MTATLCPHADCGAPLRGLMRFCHACQRYVDERADKPAPAAAIPDTRSEEEIRVAIKQALRTLGFHVWDTEEGRRSHVDPGLADLLVIGHGAIVFAEIKSAKGRVRPAQAEFADAVRANGGRACLWRSEADALSFARGLTERTESEERHA